MIERKQSGETNIQVVSNSYGLAEDEDYDPNDPGNVATWYAFEADILPVFAAGNDGSETNTLNFYTRGPHVLGVAATEADQTVTDFFSRGRSPGYDGVTNYDREAAFENHRPFYSGDDPDGPLGVYRNGVAAKGGSVMSTLNPTHALQAAETDEAIFYGRLSGTSMACPDVAGCAMLVVDAYHEDHGEYPDAIDVLNTLKATAVEDVHDDYTAESVGAGFADVYAAVERAETNDLADFGEATIAPGGE
ncbi:S8 family serine peptidase [Natronococcus jeotgali]|uniref:S8 family serine peptidase n=1 Tax=Natronococcus jeotgali TaxID=413812 RepID=UPI001461455B|nr:S8 family serine peptidase [Natronococcus jeotgali]